MGTGGRGVQLNARTKGVVGFGKPFAPGGLEPGERVGGGLGLKDAESGEAELAGPPQDKVVAQVEEGGDHIFDRRQFPQRGFEAQAPVDFGPEGFGEGGEEGGHGECRMMNAECGRANAQYTTTGLRTNMME